MEIQKTIQDRNRLSILEQTAIHAGQATTLLQLLQERVVLMKSYNSERAAFAAYTADDRQWMNQKDKQRYENRPVQATRASLYLFEIIKHRLHRFRQELNELHTLIEHATRSWNTRYRAIGQKLDQAEKLIDALLNLQKE